ncbi:MAG: alpha-2-macroglobulin family protein, partial [Candidatus Sericytochromatia bacterium]
MKDGFSPQRSKMAAPSPAMAKEKKSEAAPGGNVKFKDVSDNEIRSYFPDTAHWSPVITTDKNGIAKVDVEFPDSLTTWRINSTAIDKTGKVGSSKQDVITQKDVLVRLQAPRFFVERDEIVLSGIVNNQTNESRNIKAIITTSNELENIDKDSQEFLIKADGEKRVDWRFKVKKEGLAKITLKALGEKDSDAVKLDFPVYVHGIEKNITQSGLVKDSKTTNIDINIPKEIRDNSASLKITLSPSVITTIAEALPYLAEYPYGCVEQTTSRFIPTVTVAKTIRELGIDLKKIKKNPTLNNHRNINPVYDENEINKMVKSGLNRLYKFQNSDGGFGWWSGFESDPYMSTYVLYGLNIADEAKYNVDKNVLSKALSFVESKFKEKDDNPLAYNKLYMAYVLSEQK